MSVSDGSDVVLCMHILTTIYLSLMLPQILTLSSQLRCHYYLPCEPLTKFSFLSIPPGHSKTYSVLLTPLLKLSFLFVCMVFVSASVLESSPCDRWIPAVGF